MWFFTYHCTHVTYKSQRASLRVGWPFLQVYNILSLSRTMDIIYTSFLEVYHKEVSPKTSSRLSHGLQPRLKATATVHLLLWEPSSAASDNPPKDTSTPNSICTGCNQLHLILTSSEPLGACISDENIPCVIRPGLPCTQVSWSGTQGTRSCLSSWQLHGTPTPHPKWTCPSSMLFHGWQTYAYIANADKP